MNQIELISAIVLALALDRLFDSIATYLYYKYFKKEEPSNDQQKEHDEATWLQGYMAGTKDASCRNSESK